MREFLRAGDPRRRALDKLQQRVASAKADIEAIRDAPRTHAETRAALIAEFERCAYECTPEVKFAAFSEPGAQATLGALNWADLCFLFGVDHLADLAMKRLESDGRAPGLPGSERASKIAELRTDLRKVEVAEELETLRLEASSYAILRREDADPGILFEAWREKAAA